MEMGRDHFLHRLVDLQYTRNDIEFTVFREYTESMLRTGSSPQAAPHSVSPRLSSLRSQAGESSA
jgi:hypothetical protein